MKLATITLLTLLPLSACAISGDICGVVLGHAHEPIPHATVVLCDQATGIPVSTNTYTPFTAGRPDLKGIAVATTDDDGRFLLEGVPGGRYRLLAQSWPGNPAVCEVFEKNGREIMVYGVEGDLVVPSAEARNVRITPLGECTVTIDEDFPNSDALLLVSTQPLSADPVLGFAAWRGPFLRNLVGGNRMPSGFTMISGLPEGRIYLSVFANDSAGGIGAGTVESRPGKTVRADYIPIVCSWSNGRHDPPGDLDPTFTEVKRIIAQENNYVVPFLDRLLAERGITVDRSEKSRSPMSFYFDHLDAIVSLPSGRRAPFKDVLASVQYLQLQRVVERRRERSERSDPGDGD